MADSITCPQCGRTSYNPNDVRQRYCGACHQYYDTMPVTPVRQAQTAFYDAANGAVAMLQPGGVLTTEAVSALTDFVRAARNLDRQIDEYIDHVQKLNTPTTEGA